MSTINNLLPRRIAPLRLAGLLGVAALVLGACSEDEPRAGDNPRVPEPMTPHGVDNLGGMGGTPDGAGSGSTPGFPSEECEIELVCEPRQGCALVEGEPTCVCLPGFEGQRCEDVDECALGPCGDGQFCINTPGSYLCECDATHVEQESVCVDIDECSRGTDPVCANDAECDNLSPGFSCTCSPGSVGNGLFCKADPACTTDSCSGHGDCIETPEGHVCACDAGFAGENDCEQTCSTLDLPGPLEELVRSLIGKPEGTLVPADVAHLSALQARNLALTSLSGLQCWPHLAHLDLSQNDLEEADLAPVRQLTRLKSLSLDCNPVQSLDILSGHQSLRDLSVSQNGPACPTALSDISAIASMTQLEELDLSENQLTDLASLIGLRSLRSLRLSGNFLTASDVSALGSLPALDHLILSDNDLTDLNFLGNNPWLRILEVSDNPLSDASGLGDLTHLEVLTARNTGIASLTSVSTLEHLRELDLSMNEIVDLSPVSSAKRIYWMNFRGNKIETLEPLVAHGGLLSLFVDDNPLRCTAELWAEEEKNVSQIEHFGTAVSATCASPD